MNAMNQNRLDQILIRLGYATEEQITNALQQQKMHGGRIGTHLLRNKDIDAKQLAEALSEQFGIPAYEPDKHSVDKEFVKTLPTELITGNEALPIQYDPSSGILTLVVTDPKNDAALAAVQRNVKCSKMILLVAPEGVFVDLVVGLGIEAQIGGMLQKVELPDLFEQSQAPVAKIETPVQEAKETPARPQVLLVSSQAFLKNFLVPIFEREETGLLVSADEKEVREHLTSEQVRKVLVSEDLAPQVRDWSRQRPSTLPGLDIVEFRSISESLLDSLVSYSGMYRSLTQSLRLLTEAYAEFAVFFPPYDLLRENVGNLAQALEMNRAAVDVLQLTALLIVPTQISAAEDDTLPSPEENYAGIDWHQTLEQVKSLELPWPIEDLIRAFREILSERVNLKEFAAQDPEMALSGQILALVWHHFYSVVRAAGRADDFFLTVKSELRDKSGLLARSEVVEAYLRLIETSSENLGPTANFQVLIVGKEDASLLQFGTRLRYLGYQPLPVDSVEEAAEMCDRQPPGAIFIHEPSFPKEMLISASLFKKKEAVPLYAITTESDPSKTLTLFDAGFDDVFSQPYNMDLIAARLRKSTTVERTKPAAPGTFQAPFSAFSFTDLLQGMSQGLKSVKIDLSNSQGDKAVIHLFRGQLVYALCGELQGPDAVYAVIAWMEDGEFVVEPSEDFPEQNIQMSLESVLMEGCRLLDEARAGL